MALADPITAPPDDPLPAAGDADAETLAEPEARPLSLRLQLTIWFGLSFFVILASIVAAIIVLDGGRIFRGDYEHYDWLIRLMGAAFLAALLGGVAASWAIVGAALDPLRRITESAHEVAPESIEASRIAVPDLGSEVGDAKRALNSALDRIEAGYQAQERFISNVSHELKTPIAVVFTEAQRLRKGTRSNEELQGFIGDIANQMGHLGKMVESFLTIARIDYEERLKKNEEFWFHDLLVEAVSRSNAQAMSHNVSIELGLPDDFEFFDNPTWGDPELVSSLVENLIRNALRFSPIGSAVLVTLRPESAASDDDKARPHAVIEVTDQGPGMPEEIIDTVFEPFQQASGEQERGTGLGLAIAKKVTDLHQGTIRARNRDDGVSGCVIEVRLPFLTESDWSADRDPADEIAPEGLGSGMKRRREHE